jgi:hypothetical protein
MKTRKNTLKIALLLLIAGSIFGCQAPQRPGVDYAFEAIEVFPTPPRPEGQTHVLELRADPIDTVRVAIIGLGMRGQGAVRRLSFIDQAKIVVLADVVPASVERAQQTLENMGRPPADTYTAEDSWKEIAKRDDVDLVYICTHWDLHTPIAVYSMEHGKHVATEIPAALTIEEAWQLVNTAERTRRHMMMLENCNYDFFEMATLNMAQQGLFGEIVHAEGAYIHDLRSMLFAEEGEPGHYWDMWRLRHNEKHDGVPLPHAWPGSHRACAEHSPGRPYGAPGVLVKRTVWSNGLREGKVWRRIRLCPTGLCQRRHEHHHHTHGQRQNHQDTARRDQSPPI